MRYKRFIAESSHSDPNFLARQDALDDRHDHSSNGVSRARKVEMALYCLAVITHETAALTTNAVKAHHKAKTSSGAGAAAAAVTGQGGDGEDGEDAFYLGDLVEQQRVESEVGAALADSVCGQGFLACYLTLLEDFVVDEAVGEL